MISDNIFTCTVTGQFYFIRGKLTYESFNVIYLIKGFKCLEHYVGSVAKFKAIFLIHKSKEKIQDTKVLGTLIISFAMILISFSTSNSKLLNRYIIVTYRILKTTHGTVKSTKSPSYLP